MNRREFGYLIGGAMVAAALPTTVLARQKELGWVRELRQYIINWDAYCYRWDVLLPNGEKFYVLEEINQADLNSEPQWTSAQHVEKKRAAAVQVLSDELERLGYRGSQLIKQQLPPGLLETRNLLLEV